MIAKNRKEWRQLILKRDNYTCHICKAQYRSGRDPWGGICLLAHHIKPVDQYPELELVVENGRTECCACHKKEPTQGKLFYTLGSRRSRIFIYPSRISGIPIKQQKLRN